MPARDDPAGGGGYTRFRRNRRSKFIETPIKSDTSYPPNMGSPKPGQVRIAEALKRRHRR